MQGYGYGSPPQNQEVTFFVGNGVQVTNARFVVGGQMYPMQAITSVSQFKIPGQRGAAILGAVLFGILSLILVSFAPLAFLVSAALAALCIGLAQTAKDLHGIAITTSGMQVRAVVTHDVAFVQQVLGALHQAIATR